MELSLKRLALFSRRHYRVVFGVAALLIAGSLLLASRLHFDTDILGLLPKNEPVIDEFRDALEQFGSVDVLLVAVRLPEDAVLDPYESFVDSLGQRLENSPHLEEVQYRIGSLDELVEAYLPTALLFLDQEGLENVAERLSDESLNLRAREIKRLISTPQSLVLKDLIKLDPLGLTDVFLDRLDTSRGGMALDWASGYFLSQDHRMLLLLAKPLGAAQDIDFTKEMVADVEARIAQSTAEWGDLVGPGEDAPAVPEVVLGGRHVIALSDAQLIRTDVIANIATSMLGVLAIFLFAFRRLGPLIYALVPLSCGLILTFGFASLSFGVLSAATSGVAALLIGLGVDFVIVSYGRFVEERQRGRDLAEAVAIMNGSSGRAVVVGAITSAATFYAFGVTDFTGLYQMGYLTGTGILLCMVAVLFLLPAMLAWAEDHQTRRQKVPRHFLHGFGSGRLVKLSLAYPRLVLSLGLLLTIASLFFVRQLEFEDSISAMRPKGNVGVEIRDEVAERYGVGFDQMMLVLDGDSAKEVIAASDRAARLGAELVDRNVLNDLDSISSVLPPFERQEQALAWLAEGRDDLLNIDRIDRTFSEALAEQGVRKDPFVPGLELFRRALERTEPMSLEELSASPHGAGLVDRYLHRDGDRWQSVVYLYPPPKQWRRQAPPEAEALVADLGSGAALTGANVISNFLRVRVLEDARLAALLGFVVVGFLLWLDFRRLDATLLSLAPLTMGIAWMLGGMALLDLPMNFMNIFVSTMIIGIGVDYGVHMIHRHREFSRKAPEKLGISLVETGKAITIAAASTIVGFGSLSRSHYPGLASMGIVAILGAVSTCLVAITVLPAYLAWRERGNIQIPE